MKAQDLNYIVEVLRFLSEAESIMADFYKVCSQTFTTSSEFWEELIKDELRHEKNVKKIEEIITMKHDYFIAGRPIKKEAVKTFINYVNQQKHRVLNREIDELRILYIARDIEQSIIENKFFEIVSSTDVEFTTLANALIKDTKSHKEKLEQRIKLLEGR